jgi:hypothetical protein
MPEFHESKRFAEGRKTVFVDIDETICFYSGKRRYDLAEPHQENIAKINRLHEQGWEVIYWTARGSVSGTDYHAFTEDQLRSWGCEFHELITGCHERWPKPRFDMIIDDKAQRIEEL